MLSCRIPWVRPSSLYRSFGAEATHERGDARLDLEVGVEGHGPRMHRRAHRVSRLVLVAQLVALHGGAIEAESAGLGKGSTFTVDLPLDPIRAAP